MATLRKERRKGLAPLEMVLWLPILLWVAGLMVSLGTMTAWRVRGEVASRDVVWRTRYPRTGSNEGHPPSWPDNARMELQGDNQISELEDDEINHPVVREDPPNGFQLNDLLDPDVGALRGETEITRRHILASQGDYQSGTIAHSLLTNLFRYREVNIPYNSYRRSRVLYDWPEPDPGLENAYEQAYQSLLSMSLYGDLQPLDKDFDFIHYRGSPAPDFHPRATPNMCEIDPEVVREERVKPLVDHTDDRGRMVKGRISRLPRTMTNAFLGLYRSEVARLEQLLEDLPPGQTQGIQQEIDQLEEYIDQLTQYDSTLQQAGI